MSYGKEQWFMIVAAIMFLIGAVFMLINTFGAHMWAFWIGLSCASAGLVTYSIVLIEKHIWKKKYTVSDSEIEQAKNSPADKKNESK